MFTCRPRPVRVITDAPAASFRHGPAGGHVPAPFVNFRHDSPASDERPAVSLVVVDDFFTELRGKVKSR
jgi:hypothetical protein